MNIWHFLVIHSRLHSYGATSSTVKQLDVCSPLRGWIVVGFDFIKLTIAGWRRESPELLATHELTSVGSNSPI